MNSFYGGLTGQHFKFSAIFPSRTALAEDLNSTTYSPVGLDEFVLISYGMLNLTSNSSGIPLSDYNNNRKTDLDKYGRAFNSTLWQKVYSEDLQRKDDSGIIWYKNSLYTVADIEGYQKNSDNEINMGYCYICLGTFTGPTPLISVERISIAPADLPEVEIDNSEIDKPKITFFLPEAVEFFWDIEVNLLDQDPKKVISWQKPEDIKAGDYLLSKIDDIYLYNGENLEYKGTFIPSFINGETKYINAFKQDKTRNLITIDLVLTGHKSYKFNYNIPNLIEIGKINTKTLKAGEAALVTLDINDNNIDFNFSIPEGVLGVLGNAAMPIIKYSLEVIASNENNDYKNDIIGAIPEDYKINSQEIIFVEYTTFEGLKIGYTITNPNNEGSYKIFPLGGGSGGSGGSGTWEELE